jgi:hypothetical protein
MAIALFALAGLPTCLKVGFGGYEEPAALAGGEVSWPPNGGVAITTGNCTPRRALAGGAGGSFQFVEHNSYSRGPWARTFLI